MSDGALFKAAAGEDAKSSPSPFSAGRPGKLGLLRAMFTEDDAGQIWDALRIGFALGLLTFLGLAIDSVAINRVAFDPLTFGSGFGALITGAGASIFLNGRSTPK